MDTEKDWLVSDDTCLGCVYYGWIYTGSVIRCCDYTYYTGVVKQCKPFSCDKYREGNKEEMRKRYRRL